MPFEQIRPNLYRWTDTANVYVFKDAEAALLIDLGDGSVLNQLNEIGVKTVEWVLFTHHHREQCQGAAKLKNSGARTACSTLERPLFEKPTSFRKMRPTLNDAFTVYGASYVRPPIQAVPIDVGFAKMDRFSWRGREFTVAHTGGHSPGHTCYLLPAEGGPLAFAGDLMLDGAKMHTWFDTEWDYGFAKAIYELANNAAQIAGHAPSLLLPSHGRVVKDAKKQLGEYVDKLKTLARLYVRGYDINRFANVDQDPVSRPTAVPHLWQVTPHLYKFRGPDYWVNFHMLLADDGHALLVDCGLFDRAFLDQTLQLAKERLGLKQIDAVFVTHMHGDHALDAGFVREKYGAKLWAMEGVVDKFERPWDYDYCALLPMYDDRGKPDVLRPLKFDRTLKDGETFDFHGFTLTCDWMPGQTKFHSCLHGVIDGKRVAFTGDNLFGGPADPAQGGNEAVVARNACVLEESYLYAAAYLHGIEPDLLLGGHCWAIPNPRDIIERLRVRMTELRAAFTALSVEDDYRYMFDPYWVHALPYRAVLKPGGQTEVSVRVRNFRDRPQSHRVEIACPPGLAATPAVLEGTVPAETTQAYPVKLAASPDVRPGLHLVAFDITRDNTRHGQLFDFVAWVGDEPAFPPPPTTRSDNLSPAKPPY